MAKQEKTISLTHVLHSFCRSPCGQNNSGGEDCSNQGGQKNPHLQGYLQRNTQVNVWKELNFME